MLERASHAGFTLVELVVTLAVVAIIVSMAVPSFTGLMNSNRLTSQSNEIIAALQSARMDAIRRNAPAYFCSSNNNATCTNTSPWTGWIVYTDIDRDNTVDAGELLRTGTVRGTVSVVTSSAIKNNRVAFRPDGLAREGGVLLSGTFRICMPVKLPAENAREIAIGSGSRISTTSKALSGACPAP
ncbi:MAG TPA: GspH/FimT family pseudopilin [Luteimonas sp.]|nr:GspH/FimT family pseudopilin [Luteimonas sp.]